MGNEFRVNTYQNNWQEDAEVVALRDGGFVVVWSSYYNNQDDGFVGTYIAAQFYDANGQKVGGEVVVQAIDGGKADTPHVAQLANGTLALTWIQDDYDDILTMDTWIMTQVINLPVGNNLPTAVSQPVRVDTVTSDNAVLPQVVATGNGGYIVAFGVETGTNLFDQVYYRAYNASGQPIGMNQVLNVNSNEFDELSIEVASLSIGNSIVIWNSEAAIDDGTFDGQNQLRATLFGANGQVLRADFPLTTHIGGAGDNYNYGYDVVATGSGGFAVVNLDWSDDLDDPNGARSYYVTFYGANGQPQGQRVVIHSSDSIMGDVQMTRLANGLYVATWTQSTPGEIGDDVYARVLGANGRPLGDVFEVGVDADTYDEQTGATITALAGGGFVITYESDSIDSDENGIAGRIFGRGTVGDDTLTVDASGFLSGLAGNDVLNGNHRANALFGDAGNDTLSGLGGNDTLNGGAGADTMRGGAGNDAYVVDNAGDRVIEGVNQGVDAVQSSIRYTLGANVENLTLTGSAAIAGLGNGLANRITGNAAANTLDGRDGNDILSGGAGNDVLIGGLGQDQLTGGAGRDVFRFNTAVTTANADRILDFNVADDTIQLDNAVMAGLGATGRLAASAFVKSLAGVAIDANDRVIYDIDSGRLYYDADGNGAQAAQLIATLKANLALTAADFVVI